jgi:hypothetical protein
VCELELGFEIIVNLDTFTVYCLNHTNFSDSDTIPYLIGTVVLKSNSDSDTTNRDRCPQNQLYSDTTNRDRCPRKQL